MDVPFAVDLEIQAFSGSGIIDYNAGLTNCIVNKKGNGAQVTQRPSIDVSEDSTGSGLSHLNDRARGIYYWENNAKLYIVHDNDMYATNQQTGSSVSSGLTAGTERVAIFETIGTPRLVILDAENNEGWVMSTGETVAAINDAQFPSTLTHGGAILDTYLFVMDEDGLIYNSDVNDPTSWEASGFVNSERENDKGCYLGKHHDHLVAFGTRTIEFFFDNSNTVASPLNRIPGLAYNVGCSSGLSVWENGDIIYFIGSNPSGGLAVYKLSNFKLTMISNDSINSYITQGLTQSGLKIVFSGYSPQGHDTLLMTVYTLTGASPGKIVPQLTISYDDYSQLWGFYVTASNSLTTFPLMAWTKRTGGQNASLAARTGEGIFYNGDIINLSDNLVPVDTLLGAAGIYSDGVYENGVYASVADSVGSNIAAIIRTGLQDGDTSAYKFQSRETVDMQSTATSQTLTIKHSDEVSNSFNSGNTIDTSADRKDIFQGGRFIKRNYQLEYSGNEQIFLNKLDVDAEAGQ